jgi:hypothetical protein
MANLWHGRLTGMGVQDRQAMADGLRAAGIDPDWAPDTAEDRAALSAGLVAAAALTPAFLYR